MYDQYGAAGLASLMGIGSGNPQGLQNQYSSSFTNQQSIAMAQQQYNWTQTMAQQKPQWVFNGITCKSVREMADIIWPTDCAEKTWFILKFE